MAVLGLATIIALLFSMFPQVAGVEMKSASAHNLQTKMNYMQFDDATYALLDNRLPGWQPGQPLLHAGDEIGLYVKVIPRDGTTTGVGGHVDFYIPNGTTVVDAGYLIPDGAGSFLESPMKGQSPIAVGDGPIGAKATTELIGMSSRGPNINGATQDPVVPATGLHRGTIAGVYGDTGIFYSTDPDTAYGSWQRFTGDPDSRCGLTSQVPPPPGKSITNNSGDTFVPCNKWDAEQMFAWGANGTTYSGGTTSLAGTSRPIVDYSDGRGNAPWGFASGVAGPQSGYAWFFDWDEWRLSARTPATMQAAMDTMGPWQRIKYPGSRVSFDQPGLDSTLLGYANIDASWLGVEPNTLPKTVSQMDTTSPKAVRWAVGQLTAFRPEYVWVKLRIDEPSGSFLNEQGCPFFHSDTFGGDAGGTDSGKDHLWRYYEPSEYTWNGCLALGKRSNDEFVRVGEYVTWKIRIYNLGTQTQTNLVVKDTLPSGVQFVSAVPAPNSGPNPLVWNYGNLTPGSKFEATVTVKVTGTGYLDNKVEATSDQGSQISTDTPVSGNYPYLVPTKTVNETSIAPGGTATYTIRVKNIGGGATGSPVTIREYLPPNFSYLSLGPVYVNGALITTATVNATNPNQPVFTVPLAIQADKELTITFTAKASVSTPAGQYCNYYSVTQNSVPITTGTQACVTVGGAAIGDTVFRDWNGNGAQDSGEEGIPGIQVCATPSPSGSASCATTDASGYYIISGLPAGTYSVVVTNDPVNHTLTTGNDPTTVNLAENEQYLTADFGYRPVGTGSIGDLVFEDKGNDGAYNNALGDVGIAGITVKLYEDFDGDGVIDPGVDALVGTTTTNGSGAYLFSNLATGYDYIVDVEEPGIDSYFGGAAYQETTAEPHRVDNLTGAYLFADFGYFKLVPGEIGDQVFIDKNGNGTYEPGTDQPLPGITVNLYRDDNGNGVVDPGEPLVQTDVSDSLGIYGFTNVPAGNYIVVVDSADPDVPQGLSPVKQQYATNLSAGEKDYTLDFPFAQLLQKSVDKTTAVAGDTLNYTVNVNYPGTTALQNVVVADAVPAGTTYVPNSANAGGYLSVDGTQVVWNLGSGASGAPGTTAPTGTALCYATKTYTALRDTYLDASNPTNNYGAATEVRTQPAPVASRKHALLYFDLAANPIPLNAQIVQADLKLAVTSTRSNHVDEIRRMVTTWQEGSGGSGTGATGATWNDPDLPLTGVNGWDGAGGPFSSVNYGATVYGSFAPSTSGVKTASVIPLVKEWALNGVPNQGIVLLSTGIDTGDARYASRENGTVANRPSLVVGYYYQSTTACNATPELPSVADTYIQKDAQTTTAGSATTMWTNPGVNDTQNYTNHSLVKFDLTAVPPGATINSVTLRVTVTTDRDGDHIVEVRRMLSPWTEAGASWGDSNGASAGDWTAGIFGANDYGPSLGSFVAENRQQYSVSLPPSLVNDWVNNAAPNNGLVLYATSTDNGDAKFATRENTTALNRPVLIVSWSATPATQPQTTTTLKAEPLYRNGSGQVKVTLTVSSAGTVAGAQAPATLTTEASGATVTPVSGPTPSGPVDLSPANPSASFVYIYNVTPGVLPGTVRWIGRPTVPANTFATAASETIITAPPLTFAATVNSGVTLGSIRNVANFSSRAVGAKLSPDLCYVIADGADAGTTDQLFTMDPATGDYVDISANSTGTLNVEALSWSPDGALLYGVEAGSLVTFDTTTEAYSIVGPIGAIQGTYGTIFNPDVDTLAFDPATGKLYAVGRREDLANNANTLLDVLFQINPATGLRVASAFGAGTDYIPINTASLATPLYDVDGITFDSATGLLYAIANDSTTTVGLSDRLVTINKVTGAVADIGSLSDSAATPSALTDVEGLSYLPELGLIGTTGDLSSVATHRSSLWLIQSSATAGVVQAEQIAAVPATPYTDWEGVACQLGPTEVGAYIVPPTNSNETITSLKASIGDRVWADLDGDGVQDPGEAGIAGVTVKLYDSTGLTLLGTTTTDASGIYHFYDLNAGTYKVTYDLNTAPPGYQPTTPLTLTATVSGTQQYVTADFGLEPPGTGKIGDTVWIDANENGGVDTGEQGLPGVTVRLYDDMNGNGVLDPTDVFLKTTTTDANGNYQFSGLQDGKYLVQVDTTSPVTSPYDGTTTIGASMDLVFGTNPKPVTLVDGQDYTTADFGYNWGGSIGDYVWMDGNRNGVPDGGEAPIGNAAVLLYFDANNNGILDPAFGDYQIGFKATNASGFYLFDNMPPGNYLVDVYEDSITTDGNRDVVPTTPNVRFVALQPSQDVLTADFGYYEGALVQGNVFWDDDRNGIFDPAEAGLSPVTVALTGTDQFGNPVSMTTTTDSNGHYSFVVPVGTYTVTYAQSTVTAINPSLSESTTPISYTFLAQGGEDWHPSFDFGVDNAGKIGDFVWNDADGDGLQDPGEPGIANVTVRLYHDSDGNGIYSAPDKLISAAATDGAGKYLFTGLADGPYIVVVDPATLPAGYTQTGDPDAVKNNESAATVSGGGAVLDEDFGYKAPANTYTVSGTIYNDTSGNGTQEAGEPGLPGVKVCLYNSTGTTALACATTGASGDYNFPGQPNGTYVVKVDPTTLPSPAYGQTGDPDGIRDNQTTVTVNNANVPDKDFGYKEQLGSISGSVCEGDGDGLCEPGEGPLASVTVTLLYAGVDGILGTPDDVITATATDGSGNYSFPNLAPGLYQIVETNPPSYVSLADRDGGNPDNITLTLLLGQNVIDQDFEDQKVSTGTIGDKVWWDVNKDGDQDAGEPGIAGVTVELLLNGNLIKSTSTDANGLYQFTGVADGNYVVRIAAPEFANTGTLYNWTPSPDDVVGAPEDLDSDGDANHEAPVTLVGGTADIDFGFTIVSSYTVTKTLKSPSPARPGEQVIFEIKIENTGKTWLSVLPLEDQYSNAFLTYGFGSNFSTPHSDDNTNDGVLNWTDLTGASPNGFGGDIAPGASKTVTVNFTARTDTTSLAGGTKNEAFVSNGVADPDGPNGPLPAIDPLPGGNSSASVVITAPTGESFESLTVSEEANGLRVSWRTVNEASILGFNVQRMVEDSLGAVFETVNAEPILSAYPGLDQGSEYTFFDQPSPGRYLYRLEVIKLDGTTGWYGSVVVTVQP